MLTRTPLQPVIQNPRSRIAQRKSRCPLASATRLSQASGAHVAPCVLDCQIHAPASQSMPQTRYFVKFSNYVNTGGEGVRGEGSGDDGLGDCGFRPLPLSLPLAPSPPLSAPAPTAVTDAGRRIRARDSVLPALARRPGSRDAGRPGLVAWPDARRPVRESPSAARPPRVVYAQG